MAKTLVETRGAGTIATAGDTTEADLAKKEPLFPNLRNAIKANPEAARALKPATYFRFVKGELPGNLEWFLQFDDMLEALLRDAREMSPEDWKEFRSQIRKRSKEAKARREKGER